MSAPSPRPTLRGFAAARLSSFGASVGQADNAEKVRAVLAITLVGVLVALQFAPSSDAALTTAAETLAIAVVAFYFGLHSGTTPNGGHKAATPANAPGGTAPAPQAAPAKPEEQPS